MGLLSLLPKEDQYFDLFTQMTLYISSAARELKEMLADKDRDLRRVCATYQRTRARLRRTDSQHFHAPEQVVHHAF